MSDAHRHGRRCYWDHLRCGWVCTAGGATDAERPPAAEPAAPAPQPPAADPAPAAEPVPAAAVT